MEGNLPDPIEAIIGSPKNGEKRIRNGSGTDKGR